MSIPKFSADRFDSSISILSLFNKALMSPTNHFATNLASSVLEEAASNIFAIVLEEEIIFASDSSRPISLMYLISFSSGSSGRFSLISFNSLSEIITGKRSGHGKYL